MKQNNKEKVYEVMISGGMIPLFYNGDKDKAIKVIKAVYAGGCRILEFTNRGDKAEEVFTEIINKKDKYFPDMFTGIGSIIDEATATSYLDKGADFIVGPNFKKEIADICNKKNIAYVPGAATPNEIVEAYESGVEIIKIFPASTLGGPSFIKAVLGPMSWLKLMPTGGVTTEEDNISQWFKAGVACIGMGSKLINKKLIEEEDYAKLTALVSEVLDIIRKVRS